MFSPVLPVTVLDKSVPQQFKCFIMKSQNNTIKLKIDYKNNFKTFEENWMKTSNVINFVCQSLSKKNTVHKIKEVFI